LPGSSGRFSHKGTLSGVQEVITDNILKDTMIILEKLNGRNGGNSPADLVPLNRSGIFPVCGIPSINYILKTWSLS